MSARSLFVTRVALSAVICFAALPLWGEASPTASAVTPPEVSFSVFRVLGALALVLALFFGGVWLFRNWQRFIVRNGGAPKLNVLEVKALGNRQALYVVAYEEQRLLLSSSPTGVALVTHLPNSDTALEPMSRVSFAESLQQMLSRKS
jgi:flagellar biogenesis protein FliO